MTTDQTIEKALGNPATSIPVRQTSIDVLAEFEMSEPHVTPRGLIFHMSRCGSTLISQMLAALPQNVVISEAGIIDAAIHAHLKVPGVSDDQRGHWLRGLVAALIRSSADGERYLFIKFDSWHVLELPLIRRTFPTVPWIFVYRHPVEVMASHARQGRSPMTIEAAARRARVLARFCQSAMQHLDDTGRLVEYRQLPAVVWTDVLGHFGVDCSSADIDRMRAVALFEAKNPSVRFHSDAQTKQNEISENARFAADRSLMPLYDELEQYRVSPH
jgi:hypothetical protein